MHIRIDDLQGREIRALLEEHLRSMHAQSPAESVHALDLDALRQTGITMWTAWSGSDLLGCGALKQLDGAHGEIKSMRTANAHRRRGVARAMLEHLVAEAQRRGYTRLSLETGATPPFAPARQLYERAGFRYCGPFDDYVADPNSVFMTKTLTSPRRSKRIALWLLAAFFVVAGVNHFANPDFYVRIMPPYLPAHRELVLISGVFEVLGGLGVLVPAVRGLAGWGLILLLLAVYPANIHMALHPEQFPTIPLFALYARLPLQIVFIAWAWWATRLDGVGSDRLQSRP